MLYISAVLMAIFVKIIKYSSNYREAAQRNSSNPSLHASLPLPTSTFSSLPPHMEGVLNPSSLPAPSHMDGTLASQYLGGGASGGSGGKGGRSNLSFQEDYITNQQGNFFFDN